MATTKPGDKAAGNAAQGSHFELSDDMLVGLIGKRGRTAVDSPYLARVIEALNSATDATVTEAAENKHVFGIAATESLNGTRISSYLRKAAEQAEKAGVKNAKKRTTVLNREDKVSKEFPHGYVAWIVVKDSTPSA